MQINWGVCSPQNPVYRGLQPDVNLTLEPGQIVLPSIGNKFVLALDQSPDTIIDCNADQDTLG